MIKIFFFLKKYFIQLLLVTVIFLMLLSSALIIVNKRIIDESSLALKIIADTKFEVFSSQLAVVQHCDVSIRGFAIIREERYMYFQPAQLKVMMERTFFRVDSLLRLQGFDDAEGWTALKRYQKHIRLLVDDHALMTKYLRNKQDSLFMDIFKQDKGKNLGPEGGTIFETKFLAFEDDLTKKAETNNKAALQNNIYIQILMLLVGIPSILYVLWKLNNDSIKRKKLLLQFQESNRTYLFDSGMDTKEANEKEIIEKSIADLQQATDFITKISKGDFDVNWAALTEYNLKYNQHNVAGKLIEMRDNLKIAKHEEQKLNWVNEGLSKFAEIIRNHQQNIESLSIETVRFLTKYLSAKQGGFFVLQETEEPYLELTACYAFEKKKFMQKQILIGEGLVGEAYLKGSPILLEDVPKGYTHIASGLGDATPTSIIIIPMKYNDKTEAVLELASFHSFEKHQIGFLEKAGEFVASAVLNIKTASKMQSLFGVSAQKPNIMEDEEML